MHRLLIVSQYFWPEDFIINELAAELVKRGFLVTVLCLQPSYPRGRLFRGYRNQQYLSLKKRRRGFSEAQMIESLVLLQTIGGDCPCRSE